VRLSVLKRPVRCITQPANTEPVDIETLFGIRWSPTYAFSQH
jgi:hypothetical protein